MKENRTKYLSTWHIIAAVSTAVKEIRGNITRKKIKKKKFLVGDFIGGSKEEEYGKFAFLLNINLLH